MSEEKLREILQQVFDQEMDIDEAFDEIGHLLIEGVMMP